MSERKKAKARHWETPQKATRCEEIECPAYNPYKDFQRDPTGYYVLIRVNFEMKRIEAGITDKNNQIVKVFHGRGCEDIYTAIFQYERKHQVKWFQEKSHIAYLGKELKKAEIALATGNNAYFQE